MTEEEKRLFDSLLEERNFEFEQIQERRKGEWRLTLTIWSGLAGTILAMLNKDYTEHIKKIPDWCFQIGVLFLILLHASFLSGVAKRHHDNRVTARAASARMATLIGSKIPEKPVSKFLDWSRGVQFCITLFLGFWIELLRLF